MRPRVSVALATYNGERYLREQLESIAHQTLPPYEIHIGDDQSRDETEAVISDFSRGCSVPTYLHRNPARLGYGENFIQTAKRCSGDWIAFSDQDDVWLPEKLERCMRAVEESGRDDILSIAHRGQIVGSDLNPTGLFIPAQANSGIRPPLSHDLLWAHYGFAQIFHRSLVAEFDTSVRVPTIFPNIDRYPHDVWISVISNILGSTLHLPDALVLYRRHETTTTSTGKTRRRFSIATVLSTGAEHYRHLGAVCREAARALRFHCRNEVKPVWRERLAAGALAYDRLAYAFETRAAVYESGNIAARLKGVAQLSLFPGYFRLGPSSLGPKAMLKDLALSFVPAFRRPEQSPL